MTSLEYLIKHASNEELKTWVKQAFAQNPHLFRGVKVDYRDNYILRNCLGKLNKRDREKIVFGNYALR